MKEVKKIVEEAKPRLPLMFFPHHGIFCDLKLNRGTEHGIYLFYVNIKHNLVNGDIIL